jgi:hypothetical protein
MKFERCEVGMFRLPGLTILKEGYDPELYQQQVAWAEENNCGTPMTENLWSFRNEKQRDWFILRWYE